MKYFLILFLVPQVLLADVFTECGEYTARGIVRAKEDGIKLIINEKSQSEYVISMTTPDQGQIAGYVNRDVTTKILLDKKFNGQKGLMSKLISFESRIPNPLNPEDSGMKLDKKVPCVKE